MATLVEEHIHIGKKAGTNEPCIRGTGTSVRAVALFEEVVLLPTYYYHKYHY